MLTAAIHQPNFLDGLIVYGLFAHPLRGTVEDDLPVFARYSCRRAPFVKPRLPAARRARAQDV